MTPDRGLDPSSATPLPADVGSWGRVHLIGVGGAGMSAIAALLAARGLPVSGSDQRSSALLEDLARAGVRVVVGHDADHVAGADVVVVSSAIRPTNPEYAAAVARGVPVVHRSVALAALMAGRRAVAVAGAHGKSTTSAMLATALRSAGFDPDFAIGATVPPPPGAPRGWAVGGGHAGDGDLFVAEADESDGSFLAYRPLIAVVTNVEPDHLDHYGDAAAFEAAFAQFAGRIRPGGHLVACADDAGSARLAATARQAGTAVVTYGTDAGDVRLAWTPAGAAGRVRVTGAMGEVDLEVPFPGVHNARNAVGAWCAAVLLGADPFLAAGGIADFVGTGRRFEDRGAAHGVRVVDDYAHHPTEVAALLRAARPVAAGRVLVLFQPHLYSRTARFAREFAEALALADEVVVTDVYAAREDPVTGVSGALITDLMGDVGRFVADRHEAARAVGVAARPGDLVLTVGAGDVTELAPEVLAAVAPVGPEATS